MHFVEFYYICPMLKIY